MDDHEEWGRMLRALSSRLTYANVMATVAVFLALGGGAYALSGIPDSGGVFHGCVSNRNGALRVVNSANACHRPSGRGRRRNPGESAISWNQQGTRGFQGLQGIQGIQGIQGQKGDTGQNGQNGATGPTYGESHSVFAEAPLTPQATMHTVNITTPIAAAKLFVFGRIEAAKVTCNPGPADELGLYLDDSFVPGTRSTPPPGVAENLSFAAVVNGPIAAGTHTLKVKAACFGVGGATVDTTSAATANYGAIVLGG